MEIWYTSDITLQAPVEFLTGVLEKYLYFSKGIKCN